MLLIKKMECVNPNRKCFMSHNHADGLMGLLPNAKLICNANTTQGDYHRQIK